MLFDELSVDDFWRDHLAVRPRDVLFIVGRGFDVRALDACDRILAHDGVGRRDLWMLCFDNGLPESEEQASMTSANVERFQVAFSAGSIEKIPINLSNSRHASLTSRNTAKALNRGEQLKAYDDVIVDISAMPRMIAMTAIAKITRLLDDLLKNENKDVNLHVLTAESVASDRGMEGGSLNDSVSKVIGFYGGLGAEIDDHVPRVWFPVLGENQDARLSLIGREIRPDEICPVIPFPSREPRRGDQIVDSYRQLLFDDFQVEPLNILHACEFNPFEAYKQLFGAIDRYRDTMHGLGGCKAYVSPLSSKLLSVGALLACYDHATQARENGEPLWIGIPYVESVSYGSPNQSSDDQRELYSIWVRGDWER